jgi:acyl-CoA synthetase (AMP-forming)/AMP-acid ligase II
MPSYVGHLVHRLARQAPARPVLVGADGRRLTRAQLDERTSRLANAFLGAGLVPGDRVAVWMEDLPETIEVYLAAAKASLVGVPIGRLLAAPEAAYVLTDVGARALVTSQGLAERVGPALAATDHELDVLVALGDPGTPGTARYEDFLAAGAASMPTARQQADDQDVLVGYTSGTTGFPKGALIRERALREILAISATARRLHLYGTGLMTASLSFPAILPADIFTHLFIGGTIHLTNGWDVERVLSTVERIRATYMYLPSPVMVEFAEAVTAKPDAIASLRTIMHSGSKAPPDKVAAVCAATGGRYVEIWGMMENSGGPVTATTEADLTGDAADIFSSVGRPVPACEVRVLDPAAQPLPPGPDNVGELVLASPALFSGYWNNEKATADAVRDGWYRSGDLGWTDEAGYVYLVDRRSDLIVSGGANIYPSEIERIIAAHPGVVEVAVVGVPHQRWGRRPVAVVVPRPGTTISEAEIVALCRAQLARFKAPDRVLFTAEIAHNASNKLLRKKVQEWAESELAATEA